MAVAKHGSGCNMDVIAEHPILQARCVLSRGTCDRSKNSPGVRGCFAVEPLSAARPRGQRSATGPQAREGYTLARCRPSFNEGHRDEITAIRALGQKDGRRKAGYAQERHRTRLCGIERTSSGGSQYFRTDRRNSAEADSGIKGNRNVERPIVRGRVGTLAALASSIFLAIIRVLRPGRRFVAALLPTLRRRHSQRSPLRRWRPVVTSDGVRRLETWRAFC
jgi:hypothetical protein